MRGHVRRTHGVKQEETVEPGLSGRKLHSKGQEQISKTKLFSGGRKERIQTKN